MAFGREKARKYRKEMWEEIRIGSRGSIRRSPSREREVLPGIWWKQAVAEETEGLRQK